MVLTICCQKATNTDAFEASAYQAVQLPLNSQPMRRIELASLLATSPWAIVSKYEL